ncbi:MAG TPA: argininosuccinate lyase [Stellaceae bacterium]|nr:argininosuccinate lyase [Stellaceae bacterium]
MTKVRFAAVFAAVLAFAAPAFTQEAKQDFKLINATGYELKALYVSPSKSDEWGDDILGQDVLSDGQAVNVHFSPKVHTCKWDLRVTYTDDNSNAVWSDIDLCTVEKITIHYDRNNDVTRATFD